MNLETLYEFVNGKDDLKQLFAQKIAEHSAKIVGLDEEQPNDEQALDAALIVGSKTTKRSKIKPNSEPINLLSKKAQILSFIDENVEVTTSDVLAAFPEFNKTYVYGMISSLRKEGKIKEKHGTSKLGRNSYSIAG